METVLDVMCFSDGNGPEYCVLSSVHTLIGTETFSCQITSGFYFYSGSHQTDRGEPHGAS